jgi:glycerophosphoryl diester phosphodiesterase
MLNLYRTIALVFVLLSMGRTDAYGQYPYNPYHIMDSIYTRHNDLVMLAAHRGVHAVWGSGDYTGTPENSLQSIYNAVVNGIEIVELDVRLTQDGVPILSHDSTWGRNTNVGNNWGACCFNPWGSLPGLTVPDTDPGEVNVGADASSDPERNVNPNVSGWSLSSVQDSQGGIRLRNSLNFQWSPWNENPPTLQNALDFIRGNRYNLVISLDIKDANAMKAAWYVVAHNQDYQNNN